MRTGRVELAGTIGQIVFILLFLALPSCRELMGPGGCGSSPWGIP
jgi:hypothetical protein